MKKNVVLSETRDVPLLLFLWKWKVSTIAALTKKFFQNSSPKTAYNRLLALRHAGLIQMKSDGFGQKFVCSLDRRGFEAIREFLPESADEGYKSEHAGHDLLLAAFHLGDWFIEKPKGAAMFSEQQLRRLPLETYPDWIPRTDTHRPDGYSRVLFRGQPATFAIEVELSQKRDDDYGKVADFYGYYSSITRVLWLVPRRSQALTIRTHMLRQNHSGQDPHDFILLDDFKQHGWDAEVIAGPDLGQSMATLLMGKPQEKAMKTSGSVLVHSLLDTRKSPHTSDSYRSYQLGDFRD